MSKLQPPPPPAPPVAHVSVGGLVSESGIAIGGNQPDSGVFVQLQRGERLMVMIWALPKKVKGGPPTSAPAPFVQRV